MCVGEVTTVCKLYYESFFIYDSDTKHNCDEEIQSMVVEYRYRPNTKREQNCLLPVGPSATEG